MDETGWPIPVMFASIFLSILVAFISYRLFRFSREGRVLKIHVQQQPQGTGMQRMIKALKSHGVKFIFTITGTDIYPILAEAEKQGIRVIGVRHENASVYAAKGVGRMTGRPGVALVTAGAGVTPTVHGAMDARMDEIPLIIFSGAPPTTERGNGLLHDIDHLSVMEPVCKKVYSVERTEDMIPIIKRAFQTSMSGTPGPVYVQLPLDVLAPYTFNATEIRGNPENRFEHLQRSLIQRFPKVRIWDDENVNDATPLPIRSPKARRSEISKSVKIIESGKKVVFVIGGSVYAVPSRRKKVAEALLSTGVPCYLEFTAKGLLGRTNDLLIQTAINTVLKEADVVVLAGVACDFHFLYGLNLPRDGKIISVGRNTKKLTLNAPRFWQPAQVVHTDVSWYLIELEKALSKSTSFTVSKTWIQTCQAISSKREKYLEKKASMKTDVHLNPIKILLAINKIIPDDAIIVTDVGDFCFTARDVIRPPTPLSYVYGSYANVGNGFSTAIGVKLSRPDAQVWIISGDGGIGYHIAEMDTLVRNDIPLIVCVGTDAFFYEIARKEIHDFGQTGAGSELLYSDYQKVAKALGAEGIRLDRDNEADMAGEFKRAQELNASGKSVLVNAIMGTTDVRDGLA